MYFEHVVPVDGDADEDVAGEEKSEDSEEGKNPAEHVAGQPHHRRGPSNFERHHHERHLKNKKNGLVSSLFVLYFII